MLPGRRSGRATPLPTTMPQHFRGGSMGGPLVYQKQSSLFSNPLNQSIQCWCFSLLLITLLVVGAIFYLHPPASAPQATKSFSTSSRFKDSAGDGSVDLQQASLDKIRELQKEISDLRNTNAALRQDSQAKQLTIDRQNRELEALRQQSGDRQQAVDQNRGDLDNQQQQARPADVAVPNQQVVFVKDFTESEGQWDVCADVECTQKIEEPFVFEHSQQITFSSTNHMEGALMLFEGACPTEPVAQCQSNIIDGTVTYNFTKKEAVFALCYCSPDMQNQPYEQHGTIHVAAVADDSNAQGGQRAQQRREI